MKKIFLFTLSSLLFLVSCKTTDSHYKFRTKEVHYFKTTIHNIDRKIITLGNGAIFETDRLIIAVNMSDAFIVLNRLGKGDAYINGTRYGVSSSRAAYDMFRYNIGYSNILKTTHAANNIIELSDGTWWQIIQKGDVDIEAWLSTNLVILSKDETTIINPYRIEAIKVKKLEHYPTG